MNEIAYEGCALVEQMGFRKTVGKVREVEQFGAKMLRLDVPINDSTEWTTRFCGGPSLYQVTPLAEDVAIDMAKRQGDPRPVKPTEYRLPPPRADEFDEGEPSYEDEVF
jgi:hypothetical protein